MATNTTPAFPPNRLDPRQLTNTLKRVLNYNDTDATKAAFFSSLPANAFVTKVEVEIVVGFTAGSTNPITVGTNPTAYNNLMASTDISSASTGVYFIAASPTAKLGRAFAATGDTPVFATYLPTGTAASTGQAIIVIEYEGGWSS